MLLLTLKAVDECKKEGAQLARIKTQAEHDWLKSSYLGILIMTLMLKIRQTLITDVASPTNLWLGLLSTNPPGSTCLNACVQNERM